MIWFYNLIIGLGGLTIGLLAFSDEIAAKLPRLVFLRSLILKIPIFIAASFGIILATINKDIENERLSGKEMSELRDQMTQRDSSHFETQRKSAIDYQTDLKQLLDSSYTKSIKASNEALAKYNLILIDSLNHVEGRITTKSSYAQLSLAAFEHGRDPMYVDKENNEDVFKIKFISVEGTSYNINLHIYFIAGLYSQFRVLRQFHSERKDEQFLVQGRQRTFIISLSNDILSQDTLSVIILGTFSRDSFNKDIVHYRQTYEYDFKGMKFLGGVAGIDYDAVIKKLRELNF